MADTTTRAEDASHDHTFGTDERTRSEGRTWAVVGITLGMMAVEIAAGKVYGSMALLADGWHMGTHAAALGIAGFAYLYTRQHASDPRFSFGTGKVGALAGFASAVGLAVMSLMVLVESVDRLAFPRGIRFTEAIVVAVVGLVVNVVCALILQGHDHDRDHDHGAGGHHHDHNLRGAYLHVVADAFTSVLAIAALLAGRELGWGRLDPAMGVVGAVVIARWAVGLLRDTSMVLLDAEVAPERLAAIREAVQGTGDCRVTDLHVWRVGPRHMAAILSVAAGGPREPDAYRERLAAFPDLVHVSIEVRGERPA